MDAFADDVFEDDAFAEDVFAEDVFEDDAFAEDVFAEDVFAEDAFADDVFAEDTFAEDAFAEDALAEEIRLFVSFGTGDVTQLKNRRISGFHFKRTGSGAGPSRTCLMVALARTLEAPTKSIERDNPPDVLRITASKVCPCAL